MITVAFWARSLLTKQRPFFNHSRTLLSALLWAGSFVACGAAFAQSADTPNISRLISTGQIEAARVALDGQNPSQADRAFFEAQILKAVFKMTLDHGFFTGNQWLTYVLNFLSLSKSSYFPDSQIQNPHKVLP